MTDGRAWAGGYRLPFLTLAAVVACAGLAVLIGARPGALALAVVLAAAAGVRAVVPSPGPGIAIRSRGFDVAFLGGMAALIGTFAATTAGV